MQCWEFHHPSASEEYDNSTSMIISQRYFFLLSGIKEALISLVSLPQLEDFKVAPTAVSRHRFQIQP